MNLVLAYDVQPGDTTLAEGLLPGVLSAIAAGGPLIRVSLPTATTGAIGLLMAATYNLGYAVAGDTPRRGVPQLVYSAGGPPYTDFVVPVDADPVADAAAAETWEQTINDALGVVRSSGGKYVVLPFANATNGTLKLILDAGRKSGWTSNKYFYASPVPPGSPPVAQIRFSR